MANTLSGGRLKSWGLDSGEVTNWRVRAECGRQDPEWWVINGQLSAGNMLAAIICRRDCPVIQQCRSWAQAHPHEASGMIYAGEAWTRSSNSRRDTPRQRRIYTLACRRCQRRYPALSMARYCPACRRAKGPREEAAKIRDLITERFGPLKAIEAERPPPMDASRP